MRLLGVNIDISLSFDSHVRYVEKNIPKRLMHLADYDSIYVKERSFNEYDTISSFQ